MSIVFPQNPSLDDEYTASNGVVYQWAGDRWRSLSSSSVSIPQIANNDNKVLGNDGTNLIWQTATKFERFKLNYAANGNLNTVTDSTAGIDSVSINGAVTGEVTITFLGYDFPPGSIVSYGYDYTNNKYYIVPLETAMTLRELPGGGTNGSPTAFTGGFSQIKLRLREAETGASRGTFGTTSHAWIQFTMFE